MKLSIMLFPFHKQLQDGELQPAELIRRFRDMGITGLEPMMKWVESQPKLWDELRRAADDAGMAYACYDVGVNFVGESESDRRDALDIVARGVEYCAELKCPVALLPGSKPAPGMSGEEGRKIYAEGLAKAAERVEGSGVTLTIEDYGMIPDFACSTAHVLEVVRATGRPDVKVTFDNGNFLLADERPAECFEPLKELTVHVHIKDLALAPEGGGRLASRSGRRYIGCEIGEGEGEVEQCLSLVKAAGYDGWISLEVGTSPPVRSAEIGAKCVLAAWG